MTMMKAFGCVLMQKYLVLFLLFDLLYIIFLFGLIYTLEIE